VPDLAEFRTSLDGELFSPDSSCYEAIRRPVNAAYREVRPRLVVLCRSVSDVVGAMTYATATGDRIAPRGNYPRLAAVKNAYDPHRFFDIPQAIQSTAKERHEQGLQRPPVLVDGYISGRTPDGDEESRLFVLSHRPAPKISETQTLVTTGIENAVAAAREAAEGKDVALMGGGVLTSALEADLVDEVILNQVPVLLGAGRSFFHELPEHVHLRMLEAVPAPGVTHLHYEVVR
jgi:RibD C-terminal domain/Berberine and berberine like